MKPILKFGLSVCLLACVATLPSVAGDVGAKETFDRLKALTGTWEGHAAGEGEGEDSHMDKQPVKHVFEVSAAGTVVMETMNPGSDHEMINMYSVDGDELILTHYCAGGNQPRMQLNRAQSSAEKLVFGFTGGTNLDPKVDNHIHEAEIAFNKDGQMVSSWIPYGGGKPVGKMTFLLGKAEGGAK